MLVTPAPLSSCCRAAGQHGDSRMTSIDPSTSTDSAPSDPRIERFEAMVARFPDRSPPRFSLARALQDAGRYDAATEHYAKAAALQPDLMMAWLHWAECLMASGRYDEVREPAERARALAVSQGHEGPLADVTELLEDLDDEVG